MKGRSPAAARLALAAGDAFPPLGNLLTGTLSVALQSDVGAGVNYFLGRVSREGSPWYFPVALAVKAPLGLLLGLAVALAARESRRFAAVLGAALLLFLLLSARTTYNIGVRHALLFFPLAAVAAGAPSPSRPRASAAPRRSGRSSWRPSRSRPSTRTSSRSSTPSRAGPKGAAASSSTATSTGGRTSSG